MSKCTQKQPYNKSTLHGHCLYNNYFRCQPLPSRSTSQSQQGTTASHLYTIITHAWHVHCLYNYFRCSITAQLINQQQGIYKPSHLQTIIYTHAWRKYSNVMLQFHWSQKSRGLQKGLGYRHRQGGGRLINQPMSSDLQVSE